MREAGAIRDSILVEMSRPRGMKDMSWLTGFGVCEVFGPDGALKSQVKFKNLCTTAGDQYYCRMAGALVGQGGGAAQPTKANGMKLGTGSGNSTPTKSGAGAALQTSSYTAATNLLFDATYPQFAAFAGTDTGWQLTYKTTWGAGVPATAQTFYEVVIVNDQASNATSTAANTYHRATFAGGQTKNPADTLSVTWNVVFLGS